MTDNVSSERSIFESAIEKQSPEERAALLAAACGDDRRLREGVEALLAAHDRLAPAHPPGPAAGSIASFDGAPGLSAGAVVGPYKLMEQIGEGGMGLVFVAEQQQPVRRKVALKVIKPGMDTRAVVARFEAERQALALMDHPNIAKVLDGGATDTGRPYFVMELVKGVPITEFCDQNRLSTRQRLELFLHVCRAVQHAHQKGVIHRDLKPNNVLVASHDGTPVVKVIDFGVAKAVGQQLTDKTVYTLFAQLVGTPLYMSPEQAGQSSLDVDTRTDVYALGVLLYELLTGTTPFDKDRLSRAGYDELRRIIREEEPPRPSARISTLGAAAATVSACRGSEPRKLSALVRGELDWIVMKALEKDRTRRYETASGLAQDVERYLKDEPVEACPPSAWYRLCKFARRNRRAVATGSAVVLAVLVAVAALATSTVLIARALRSETRAKDDLAGALEREQQDAYFHRIALAHRELSADNLRRARELLDECPERLRDWEWHYLARLCGAEPLVIRDTAEVNSLAFGRGGEWIAAARGDGSLKIWDGKTGKLVRTIPNAHDRYASSVACHPDGDHLASVGADRLVKVWDLTTDPPTQVFSRECDAVRPMGTAYAVAFRPGDGRYLVAGHDGAVNLWDWRNNRLEHRFAGHGRIPISVAFSRDGRRLASGDWQGRINLWDPDARGGPVRTFTETGIPISALAFRPDAGELAAASYDRRVDVWDTNTGEYLRPVPHTGRRAVLCVAFGGPNGRLLATSGEDKTVHVRETATGRELLGLRGHTGTVTCLAFSPDGRRLVSAGKDGTIRVWDGTPLRGDEGREEARTFSHHANEIWSLAVRPIDGRMVVSGGFKTPATVWDPQSGAVVAEIPGQSSVVFCVAWSPDGQRVASAGVEGAQFNLQVVNLQDRSKDFELSARSEFMAVAFHPDGKHLVTGQQDGTIRVWDTRTGRALGTFGTHGQPLRGVAFSRDGRHLASASVSGEIKLWDATRLDERHLDGKAERRVAPMRGRSPGMCLNLSFSPDGQFLASGGEEYTVRIFDVETGREAHPPLRGHKEDVYAVAFSPDGRWLASAGEDSTVRVWDCRTGYALARTFRGHTGLVNSLAFSPDGKELFSGSNDHTVMVWNMARLNDQPGR
jgi:WD40 repeat protein/serine/threonine protein kinase